MSRILVIGAINIDYVYQVPKFVQPGETLSSLSLKEFPGGKGLNQSVALGRAGAQVCLGGKIGENGLDMLQMLTTAGVETSRILTNGSTTGHAIIQVDAQGQNCILLHGGANQEFTRAELDELLEGFGTEDILVLQNEINELPYLMGRAWARGIPIAFNPSPVTASLNEYPIDKVTWLILNEVEGKALTSQEQPDEILRSLKEHFPRLTVVLTLGKDGAVYEDRHQRIEQEIYPVPVVDTTAAGDTFMGYFVAGIADGQSPRQALECASRASAIAVSRMGASSSIPTTDEVHNYNFD